MYNVGLDLPIILNYIKLNIQNSTSNPWNSNYESSESKYEIMSAYQSNFRIEISVEIQTANSNQNQPNCG